MFDRGENRSFFTVCTLVLAVLGVFGLYALSLTEVPMGTYMGTVVLFLLLMLCTAAGVVFDCRIVAWLFPLVVAGTYLIFNISLNWLAGFRAFDDFPGFVE